MHKDPDSPDFQLLFESAAGPRLVLTPGRVIAAVTSDYLRITGTTRAELVGKSLGDLERSRSDERFRSFMAELDRSVKRVVDERRADTGSMRRLDVPKPDGVTGTETRVFLGVNVPVLADDGGVRYVVHHLEDAASQFVDEPTPVSLGMRELARLCEARLATAVEAIQDALALFDQDNRLVLCNGAFRRLLGEFDARLLDGRTHDEILDVWLEQLEFASPEHRARFRAERSARLSDAKSDFDLKTKEGRSLRVSDRRTADGGLVRTVWDLTDDVRLASELRDARAAAEAASAAKSEFLSSMSHELRTPLNAVLGFAQLLRRDKKHPLSEPQRQRVEHILKGGAHLLRLIEDILDLSRIEAGQVSISVQPVDVFRVLEDVKTTLDPTAERAGIRFELATAASEVPTISADETRFSQILMNFGSNAIKYNRADGRVTFTVSVPSPDRVRVTVTDTGVGIPSEKQGSLFKPFQRAGQEAGPIEGTGIGLVITKRLAERMRGGVGFRSVWGVGSEFWVDMPVHSSHARSNVPRTIRLASTRPPAERLRYRSG
ncbi:MAG TPA: ATP-binding protein [Polyangiaceae bacterium]|nr:ATP-binding protein [Polyangiaceae bacterium]